MKEFLVQPDIEQYAEEMTTPEPEILRQLVRETHLKTTAPQMLSGHMQGMLLRMISQMVKPNRVLEIGTFTGYSAICLSAGIPDGAVLHTVECNPELEEIAGKYFKLAGICHKVKLHIGDAFDIVPTLGGFFDLVFIDANKDDYIRYFDMVFDEVQPGGYILADNTLWYGRVIGKNAASDRETSGIVEFNKYVQSNSRVENLLLPLRDGLTVIRKLY